MNGPSKTCPPQRQWDLALPLIVVLASVENAWTDDGSSISNSSRLVKTAVISKRSYGSMEVTPGVFPKMLPPLDELRRWHSHDWDSTMCTFSIWTLFYRWVHLIHEYYNDACIYNKSARILITYIVTVLLEILKFSNHQGFWPFRGSPSLLQVVVSFMCTHTRRCVFSCYAFVR